MNLISMILYGTGLVGMIISLVLTFVSISKSSKISFVLIGCTFILSLLLIGGGTFITLKTIKSNNLNPPTSNTDNTVSVTENNKDILAENNKTASTDDLRFQCKFDKSTTMPQKNASITIENRSDSVFNGEIKLNFTDSSNQTTDTMVIPVKNLMPKSSYSPKILVDSSASNADYSFSGAFDKKSEMNIPYTIKKISIGNNTFRFDVSVKDTSYSNLQSISNEFLSQYPSNTCNSFLIYFYPSDKGNISNFNDVVADFYLNYPDNVAKLTTYNN